MTFESLKPLLAGAAVAASLAFVAACSGTSSSMIPTAPTASASSAAASANFSPNPGDPPTCETDPSLCEPPPPPPGTPCSPGYWKNHITEFNSYCSAAAAVSTSDRFSSCGSLMTALTCRGSDASCGRNAAALLLDQVSGCTESED